MIGLAGYFEHTCCNCGHKQSISVNNDIGCLDYCKECSWKPSFGTDGAFPMFGNQAYRRFKFTDSEQIQPNPYLKVQP